MGSDKPPTHCLVCWVTIWWRKTSDPQNGGMRPTGSRFDSGGATEALTLAFIPQCQTQTDKLPSGQIQLCPLAFHIARDKPGRDRGQTLWWIMHCACRQWFVSDQLPPTGDICRIKCRLFPSHKRVCQGNLQTEP